MKKSILLVFTILLTFPLFAQEPSTLGKKKFFKKDDSRTPTYTNNPKYFVKETINSPSRNDGRKKFNFKKGKKRFKNRSRPKAFKFKKFKKNR